MDRFALDDEAVLDALKRDARTLGSGASTHRPVGVGGVGTRRPNLRFLNSIMHDTATHNAALKLRELESAGDRLRALRGDPPRDADDSRRHGRRRDHHHHRHSPGTRGRDDGDGDGARDDDHRSETNRSSERRRNDGYDDDDDDRRRRRRRQHRRRRSRSPRDRSADRSRSPHRRQKRRGAGHGDGSSEDRRDAVRRRETGRGRHGSPDDDDRRSRQEGLPRRRRRLRETESDTDHGSRDRSQSRSRSRRRDGSRDRPGDGRGSRHRRGRSRSRSRSRNRSRSRERARNSKHVHRCARRDEQLESPTGLPDGRSLETNTASQQAMRRGSTSPSQTSRAATPSSPHPQAHSPSRSRSSSLGPPPPGDPLVLGSWAAASQKGADHVVRRGRGVHSGGGTGGAADMVEGGSAMDRRFVASYDPRKDVQQRPLTAAEAASARFMGYGGDGGEGAAGVRARWQATQKQRLIDAGFSPADIDRWEAGGSGGIDHDGDRALDENSVKWNRKGEGREWDKGKILSTDGSVDTEVAWARLGANDE